MTILKLSVGDVVRTRKAHPCGSDQWEIIRLGADVRITCAGCGRSVLMPRVKLERRIKQFVRRAEPTPGPEPSTPGSGATS